MNTGFSFRTAAEIAIVFAVILSIKALADSVQLTGAGSVAMWCGVIVATLFMKRDGITWRALGLVLPTGFRQWASTLGLALLAVVSVIVFMIFILEPVTTHFNWVTPPEAPDRWAFMLGKPYLFIAYLVVVVWVGAALGEELVMRGFVLNRLADLFGQSRLAWISATIVHAVIFGLLHIYQGIPGMVGTGVVALIFAGIYLIGKRRLLPVIIGHGIVNTISLTAYYLSDGKIT